MTETAVLTAIVYFGTFLAIGWGAKKVIDRWMSRKGVGLSEIHDLAGPNRGERDAFLLGVWRKEK